MPYNCYDCEVEVRDETGDPNKCSYDGEGCHNCITWGPTKGDGDNPWYERKACVGCKGRLIDGRFKAADKWKAKADEMKAKLAAEGAMADRLRHFYRINNVALIGKADSVAKNHLGREQELNEKLHGRYGVDLTSLAQLSAMQEQQMQQLQQQQQQQAEAKKRAEAGAEEAAAAAELPPPAPAPAPAPSVAVAAVQVASEDEEVAKILAQRPCVPLMQSSLGLVGEGRGGKTCLYRSLKGLGYVDTPSTIGMNEQVFSIDAAYIQAEAAEAPEWTERGADQRRMEEALARCMLDSANAGRAPTIMEAMREEDGRGPGSVQPEAPAAVPAASRQSAHAPMPLPPSGTQLARAAGLDMGRLEDFKVQVAQHGEKRAEPLVLKVQDCGGQEQFQSLLYLVLNGTRGFLVTFSMEWLKASVAEKEQEEHLCFLLRWCSIIRNHSPTAPIFFVGTHSDTVPDLDEHKRISDLICDHFDERFQPVVFQNASTPSGPGVFYFFPVDNTKGREDPVLQELMKSLLWEVLEDKYVKAQVPVVWMALLDWLQGLEGPTVSLAEVKDKCTDLGIAEEMQLALRLFDDLGVVMYHSELVDLVVLNPNAFFITPATFIARDWRNHTDNETWKKIQKAGLYDEYIRLRKEGILDRRLLNLLWAGLEHQPELLQLMCKCNTFVPVTPYTETAASEEFLVPALLGNSVPSAEQGLSSFFILFPRSTQLSRWTTKGGVKMGEADSSYPHGVFEGLLADALQTSQALGFISVEDMELTRFHGKFEFKTHRFHMTLLEEKGMVEVVVQTPSVRFVMEHLGKKARDLALGLSRDAECCLAVPEDGGANGPYREYTGSLVLVESLREADENNKSIHLAGKTCLPDRIRSTFSRFLNPRGLQASYHVFESYRQGGFDTELAADLFRLLSLETVTVPSSGAVEEVLPFWDQQVLEPGRDFQQDFCEALAKTTVAVPIITEASMKRMQPPLSDSGADNVLLEWTLIRALYIAGRLPRVFPILVGSWDDAKELSSSRMPGIFCTDLFASPMVKNLPKVVHEPTMRVARTMLPRMGVETLPPDFDQWTVYDIFHGINGLGKMNTTVRGWKRTVRSKSDFFTVVKDEVMKVLEQEITKGRPE